ncbi:hypothetical protein VTK56DRAFT_7224 [Thermocarpiscus australiensis]
MFMVRLELSLRSPVPAIRRLTVTTLWLVNGRCLSLVMRMSIFSRDFHTSGARPMRRPRGRLSRPCHADMLSLLQSPYTLRSRPDKREYVLVQVK